jgi:hypothetical protein
MVEDVLVTLNPGLLWQKLHLTEGLFLLAKWAYNEEETSKMLYLEYSFTWCLKLDGSGSTSQTTVQF